MAKRKMIKFTPPRPEEKAARPRGLKLHCPDCRVPLWPQASSDGDVWLECTECDYTEPYPSGEDDGK